MKINFRKKNRAIQFEFQISNQAFLSFSLLVLCAAPFNVVSWYRRRQWLECTACTFLGETEFFRWEIFSECVQLCNNLVEFAWISGTRKFERMLEQHFPVSSDSAQGSIENQIFWKFLYFLSQSNDSSFHHRETLSTLWNLRKFYNKEKGKKIIQL